MFKKILNDKKGITLLELIVSVAIFSLMMVSVLGIFKIVIDGQRNAISSQNIQESMRYAFETMSKEVRMAQKNTGTCQGTGSWPTPHDLYNTDPAKDVLFFVNKDGACATYQLVSGGIQITRDGLSGFITPHNINISNLQFNITDSSSSQPKVTMNMDIQAATVLAEQQQKIKLETTISSRYYE